MEARARTTDPARLQNVKTLGVDEHIVRHEALVRREALGVEGGARPPRRAVAAAWWELSAVRPGRRRGGREAALTKPGRSGTARRVGFGERDQRAYERNQW